MGLCTFIFLVFFLSYTACGVFTYYLEWSRTPLRLFRLMKSTNGTMHYYMLSPFFKVIMWWPTYLRSTWKHRWINLLSRVKIIIFLWLLVFGILSLVNIYMIASLYENTPDLIFVGLIFEYVLWVSSGVGMYVTASFWTNNKAEAFSMVGFVLYAFFLLLPGPLAFRWVYDLLEKNITEYN